MITKTLYRYKREEGCVTVSTEKPENISYEETYRLIADEGMILTNGVEETCCVDTDHPEEWSEIEAPEEPIEEGELIEEEVVE